MKYNLSIIIPMYNSEESILRCLKSIINQTYSGCIQIIIINDGSTDSSVNIVNHFISVHNKYNILLVNQANSGVSSARNSGLKIAKGSFIALLDSDDVWLENKLEIQMNILENNPEIDFLGCSRNNEKLTIFGKKIDKLHKAKVIELLIKMYPQTSTAIFKRELFLKFGGYNENMTHAEDGNLWVRYCANSNFYYSPKSLIITGDGKPSFGHSGLSANLKAMFEGNIFIIKEAREKNLISNVLFVCFYFYYVSKYLRRILLTKISKSCSTK